MRLIIANFKNFSRLTKFQFVARRFFFEPGKNAYAFLPVDGNPMVQVGLVLDLDSPIKKHLGDCPRRPMRDPVPCCQTTSGKPSARLTTTKSRQTTRQVEMNESEIASKCEEAGEKYLGEGSYKTPEPCTPDTCVTSTLSCVPKDEEILLGDFKMKSCQGLPQLTLGLLKPDGMEYMEEIEARMREEGFDIVQSRVVQLSPEQASNFYHEHYGQPYFPILVTTMCEGPIKVYILRKKDAIPMWKLLCGPTCVEQAKKLYPESLRALYGISGKSYRNVCHGSATEEKAREEIRFFFPSTILDENIQSESNVEEYLKEWVNPTLLEGLTQLCKSKPLDPTQWLGEWLLINNPYKPKMAREIAITPT